MKHFYVKFGYTSCIGFLRYRVDKQTDGNDVVQRVPGGGAASQQFFEFHEFFRPCFVFYMNTDDL